MKTLKKNKELNHQSVPIGTLLTLIKKKTLQTNIGEPARLLQRE